MIPREVLRKVRYVEITTRGLVNEVFGGEYHSVFKGRGIDFAEVREYQYGDDIRSIDWNVTARTGQPFVKVFEEERELTVMLVVDVSASGDFGTRQRPKGEVAIELCALLAFSAIENNDKVGLLIFSDRVEKFVPPRKGRKHVLRVLRELFYHRPEGRKTDIGVPLEYLGRVLTRRAVVFLVSDFLADDFRKPLAVAGRRHDLIAVRMSDRREEALPPMGIVDFEDPTGPCSSNTRRSGPKPCARIPRRASGWWSTTPTPGYGRPSSVRPPPPAPPRTGPSGKRRST